MLCCSPSNTATAPVVYADPKYAVHMCCLVNEHVSMPMQIVSGKGVLGQLSLETGLPTNYIEIGLVALIGYNLFSVSKLCYLQVLC